METIDRTLAKWNRIEEDVTKDIFPDFEKLGPSLSCAISEYSDRLEDHLVCVVGSSLRLALGNVDGMTLLENNVETKIDKGKKSIIYIR